MELEPTDVSKGQDTNSFAEKWMTKVTTNMRLNCFKALLFSFLQMTRSKLSMHDSSEVLDQATHFAPFAENWYKG